MQRHIEAIKGKGIVTAPDGTAREGISSMKVLVDRSLERHAGTHATRMMPHSVQWGAHQFELPVAQRSYDQPRENELFLREQLPYLVSLCRTAKDGKLAFFTSRELEMEAFRQRTSKQGYLGIDWFSGVQMINVPCPVDRFASWNKVIDPAVDFGKDEQLAFFRSITHPRFLHLRTTLEDAHLADAFHVWTAEQASLDVFLTTDKRFLNNVQNRLKAIGLMVPVMTPRQLCEKIGLLPSDIEQLAAEIN
jgi:hypothetical protein